MIKQLLSVNEFHHKFGVALEHYPVLVKPEIYEMRHKLMEEENNEYLQACQNKDMVEIADALGDKLYILCGTILSHGMQHIIFDVFDEIHRSNLSKLGADGKPVYREDGKVLKGENYSKPDLEQFINAYKQP